MNMSHTPVNHVIIVSLNNDGIIVIKSKEWVGRKQAKLGPKKVEIKLLLELGRFT